MNCVMWDNLKWFYLATFVMSSQQQKKSKHSVENFDSGTEGCESFMFNQRFSGKISRVANLLFY